MSSEAAAVDLSGIIPSETTVFEIKQPGTGEATGWKITLAGPSHQKAIAYSNDSARRTLRRQHQIEAQQANGKKVKPDERTVDEVRADNVAWVVSRIVDWTPVKIGNIEYRFTDETATELLLQPKMGWALMQLIDAIADDATFTSASATN